MAKRFSSTVSRSSPSQAERERIDRILAGLASLYPDAHCELNHTTPFELLVATVLSAQSTDARVNQVTARLFQKYNTPETLAALSPEALAAEIQELGLYRNKAKSLVALSKQILAEHDGEVPQERAALEALPGVGRKTANVVLSNAFGVPAIAVDTHVFRVSHRLGLAHASTPEAVEKELMQVVPEDEWTVTHHRLIFHGRRICMARRPLCEECPLRPDCPFGRLES